MTTLIELWEACDKLGCKLDDRGDSYEIDAPQGKCFEPGLHHRVFAYYSKRELAALKIRFPTTFDGGASKLEARNDALEVLAGGVQDCEIVDCEWCNDI